MNCSSKRADGARAPTWPFPGTRWNFGQSPIRPPGPLRHRRTYPRIRMILFGPSAPLVLYRDCVWAALSRYDPAGDMARKSCNYAREIPRLAIISAHPIHLLYLLVYSIYAVAILNIIRPNANYTSNICLFSADGSPPTHFTR